MLQGYHLITLTHRQASLEEIGRLIPDSESLPHLLTFLKNEMGWEELMWASTCNRMLVAWYAPQTPEMPAVVPALLQLLQPTLSPEALQNLGTKVRVFHGGDAVRHIFEVAASMDSLVIGEREIVRQMRESYEQCAAWGLTGDHFRLLMQQAIEVSKQVFNETGIGEKALSVVALAYGAMRQKGIGPDAHVVLVGAGATNTLMAKFLRKDGFKKVTVLNRSRERALELANQFEQGAGGGLDEWAQIKAPFDAMVVCTAAVEPVVTPAVYAQVLGEDRREKVVVDLSVPNNVSLDVPARFPVHFIEIEGLRVVAEEHMAYRETARQKAEVIITERLIAYRSIWHQRQVERALHPMVDAIKDVKKRAIGQVFADRVAELDPSSRDLLLEMMNYMEKKCIAIPVKTVKEIAQARNAFQKT